MTNGLFVECAKEPASGRSRGGGVGRAIKGRFGESFRVNQDPCTKCWAASPDALFQRERARPGGALSNLKEHDFDFCKEQSS